MSVGVGVGVALGVGVGVGVSLGVSVSVSVALLLARSGSVTPLGAVTVAVSETLPVADDLIRPFAL